MSLDVYRRFLSDQSAQSTSLAPDVSLNYIPTTTKVEGIDAVRSHLAKQERLVKTKAQKILDVVEGASSLCVDVETTLEFDHGGGAYLPSLDENFLTGRVASFPTVHIVRFNSNLQIQNVRIHWDQGSLLKLVEVIGSRSRGWPIREAADQTKMIKAAIARPIAESSSTETGPIAAQSTPSEDAERPSTPVGKRRIRDPYAAESLTDLLSPDKNDRTEPVRAPRAAASARPPPRNLDDLFVADADVPTEAERRSASPSKPGPVAPKAGAGRNYQGNRLFDDDETVAREAREGGHHQIAYRTNPNRFNHFELGGDNSEREIQDKPAGGRTKSQHTTQWAFDDFVTPEKPTRALRGQQINQFPFSDQADKTPLPPRQAVVQPRRDAQTHFDLSDDSPVSKEPAPAPAPATGGGGRRIISSFQNKGKDLYRDPILDGATEDLEEEQQQRSAYESKRSSTMNNSRRQRNFESHWDMADSPAAHPNDENVNPNATVEGKDRSRAVKMMEPHWEAYDESPKRSA